jgi:hypothetical protein
MHTRVSTCSLHNISDKQYAFVLRLGRDGQVRPGRGYHPSYRTARLLCEAVRNASAEPRTAVIPAVNGWVFTRW